MLDLLRAIFRWCARHILSFVVIVVLLMGFNFFLKELGEYKSTSDTLLVLKRGSSGLGPQIDALEKEAAARVRKYRNAAREALDARIRDLTVEIQRKSADQKRAPELVRCVISGGSRCEQYLAGVKSGIEVRVLEAELAYLLQLQGAKIVLVDAVPELERLQQIHVRAYAAYTDNASRIQLLEADTSWRRHLPWSLEHALLREREELHASNELAYKNWETQRLYVNALSKLMQLPAFQLPEGLRDAAFVQLQREIDDLEKTYAANWVAKASDSAISVMPTALLIVALLIVTPIAIKIFCYFVIAPIASGRPPVCLLPGSRGDIEGLPEALDETAGRPKISAVSQAITIGADEELLLHPEFIQSSAIPGQKATRWLFDWSIPISSLAAGLYGLTRIRSETPEHVVVSATLDPFSEVGAITLPAGSSLVLHPHSLVGVVKERDRPLRISRMWRLGSLNAWLTLQLRFVVFHGPVTLLVEGCRGVRIEQAGASGAGGAGGAGGTGRAINQSATMGFSANLEYSTTRCETFGSYLMGKQTLFNDKFSGGPGWYVYEETPYHGKKSGITGRGIEGVMDTILKVFGV